MSLASNAPSAFDTLLIVSSLKGSIFNIEPLRLKSYDNLVYFISLFPDV